MKKMCLAISLSLILIAPFASAQLLTEGQRPTQEAFKESQDPCIGVVDHVSPRSEKEHHEAVIGLIDIYTAYSK